MEVYEIMIIIFYHRQHNHQAAAHFKLFFISKLNDFPYATHFMSVQWEKKTTIHQWTVENEN